MPNTHSLDLESSSSQYASITDAAQTGLDLSTDFTIEFWVKLETLQDQTFVDKFSASDGYFCFAESTGAEFNIRFRDSGNTTAFYVTDFFVGGDVGNWVHCAWAVDISVPSATCYKNGVSQSVTTQSSAATTIGNNTADFYIGSDGGAASYLDGLLDDVRIWSDIRSESEIQNNAQTELNGDEANLVAYWKFNNDYTDSTANGNDLTASGSPVFSSDIAFSEAEPGGFYGVTANYYYS